MYQRTDISAANTPVIDCVNVPPGYYSPAQDNAWYACTSPLDLPPQLQIFTTRGDGADACAVSPQLQAFLPPAADEALAQPLRPPLTAEAWFEWRDTQSLPVSIMGTTPFWHLSLQLAALPTALGTAVRVEMHLVDAAQGAAVNATLPWVRRDRWHHVAAVCTSSSCCYFMDGTDFGCAPWSNRTRVSPAEPALHAAAPAVFVGGSRGLQAAGFPAGFVNGKLAEVRLHTAALRPAQLGARLRERALASSCAEPDEMCGGRCVAGCAGDAQRNGSTCACECGRGEVLEPASGRCVPRCGEGMRTTSAGTCGCDASSFKVWRGRYLGISSPSTEPDFASHSWHHAAEQVGLAEVHFSLQLPTNPDSPLSTRTGRLHRSGPHKLLTRVLVLARPYTLLPPLAQVRLFDARLQPVAVQACFEFDLAGSSTPHALAASSVCGALYDAQATLAPGLVEATAAETGEQYLSVGAGAMRAVLDLGSEISISRIEIANYNVPLHTSQGARQLQLFLADGGGAPPTEADLFEPRHLILEQASLLPAPTDGTANATVYDDRAHSPARSAAISCSACANNASGSLAPRSSVHDCICPATHYKEWPHELGRCLARLAPLPPPVSDLGGLSQLQGADLHEVSPGAVLGISPADAATADGTPPAVCLGVGVQRGAPGAGRAPSERGPQCSARRELVLDEAARFYTVRAIVAHRMHLPSIELNLSLHTKVALPAPRFSRPGGPALAYPLAVNLTANASAEDPADVPHVIIRYTTDNTEVGGSSPQLPASGLLLSSNTTVRLRAFHPLYFDSAEAVQSYHVLLPPRSHAQLPAALQPGGVREVPEGARLQLASTGAGELRVMLSEVSSPSVAGPPCGTPPQVFAAPHGAWSRYEGTLTLTRSSADLQLCAYVHEHGYMPSAVSSALLRVRPWTQPVRIATLEPPPGPPTVTVTLAGPEGAIVWYALEAIDDSPLCEARAMAARVAPNLTLAADAAWLHAMQLQARPTATHQLACLHANCAGVHPQEMPCTGEERASSSCASGVMAGDENGCW